MDNVINNWLKCYLIGPMEKTKANDSGRGWRDKLRPDLLALVDSNGSPIYIFDPTREEQAKVDLEPKEFHKKMVGWVEGGNNDKIAENGDLIWQGKTYLEKTDDPNKTKLVHIMGDFDYVLQSNFIICRMEEGDQPCGTYMEVGVAYLNKIPIYVLQTMPRSDYQLSFIMAVYGSGGGFFQNPTQLIEYLQTTYKLKVKKD